MEFSIIAWLQIFSAIFLAVFIAELVMFGIHEVRIYRRGLIFRAKAPSTMGEKIPPSQDGMDAELDSISDQMAEVIGQVKEKVTKAHPEMRKFFGEEDDEDL